MVRAASGRGPDDELRRVDAGQLGQEISRSLRTDPTSEERKASKGIKLLEWLPRLHSRLGEAKLKRLVLLMVAEHVTLNMKKDCRLFIMELLEVSVRAEQALFLASKESDGRLAVQRGRSAPPSATSSAPIKEQAHLMLEAFDASSFD